MQSTDLAIDTDRSCSLWRGDPAYHQEQPHPSSRDAATNRGWSSVDRQLQAAFIAGAEWALEEAAKAAEDWNWRISSEPICQDCSYTAAEQIAAAIRSLSTTTTKEESNG